MFFSELQIKSLEYIVLELSIYAEINLYYIVWSFDMNPSPNNWVEGT
jgi:hypothetical protein